MKLLVFEYITGGGFNDQQLPASLLAEGAMMLRALLKDLQDIPGIELLVLVDQRCQSLIDSSQIQARIISEHTDVSMQFRKFLDWADAAWVIAPEFDGILERYTRWIEQAGKRLLSSSSGAVALTANKWLTFGCLQSAGINTVSTRYLNQVDAFVPGAWVIKPVDGVGCSNTWLIENTQAYVEVKSMLENPADFLMQPFIPGSTESISALFYQGQGWVICVNHQVLTIKQRQFKLETCLVNAIPRNPEYQKLVTQIAEAIPGLYGYVGVDLIATENELVVIEINPRLTSSYVGISEALGINCAEVILRLEQLEPLLEPTINQCIKVNIA